MGHQARFFSCLVTLMVTSCITVHAEVAELAADKNTSPLAEVSAQVRAARVERDNFGKKLKSAVSFLPIAQTQIERAQAELNTANATYAAQECNFPARGRDAALNRAQQAI